MSIWFSMGMLLIALKRPNVAILKKGHLEVPSDAQGIIYRGLQLIAVGRGRCAGPRRSAWNRRPSQITNNATNRRLIEEGSGTTRPPPKVMLSTIRSPAVPVKMAD